MHRASSSMLIALFASLATPALAGEVVPAAPRAHQPIHYVFTSPPCTIVDAVRRDGDRIVVDLVTLEPCGSPPPPRDDTVAIGRLPAGTWTIAVRRGVTTVESATFTVEANAWIDSGDQAGRYVRDIAGLWGFRDHSGSGAQFSLQADGQLAGIVYTYDAAGRPEWFTLQGAMRPYGGFWRGDALRTVGVDFSRPPRDPTYTKIADAELDFTSVTSGTLCLTYVQPAPVESRCLELVRYPFH